MRLFLAACLLFSAPLPAQQDANNATNIPQITVAAHGEVRVSPDRAAIQISVQTKALTAAVAANENATKQQAVITALHALGLTGDDISTTNYNVSPDQRYEPNREPVIVGYTVTNTVVVDVRKLNQVGPVIDAALSKGANMITSLQFYATNTDEARRTAISQAVQKARLDAEAAARASGGSIAGLLEVNIGAYFRPPPQPLVMARAAGIAGEQTPINPGEQTVSVDLTTRWRFIAGTR